MVFFFFTLFIERNVNAWIRKCPYEKVDNLFKLGKKEKVQFSFCNIFFRDKDK